MEWKKLTRFDRPPEKEEVECRTSDGKVVTGVVWMQSDGRFHCVGRQLSTVVIEYRYVSDIDVGDIPSLSNFNQKKL